MTIGVGFRCEHGIVLAADSELSTDLIKFDGDKAWYFTLPPDDPNPLVQVGIIGAGNVSFIVDAKEAIRRLVTLDLEEIPDLTLDHVEDRIRSVIHELHTKQIYPIGQPHERYEYNIWLLIGIVSKDGSRLLSTEQTAVTPVEMFHHIGKGEELARFLVAQSGKPELNIYDAILLSSQILIHASKHVRDVGGKQRIITLYEMGSPNTGWLDRDTVKKFGDFVRRFGAAAQPVMFGGMDDNVSDSEFLNRLERFKGEMMEARNIKRDIVLRTETGGISIRGLAPAVDTSQTPLVLSESAKKKDGEGGS